MRQTADGIPVIEYEETGSTNSDAMRLGLSGAATPLWVRADSQTAGRGRSGRQWASTKGNLYASLLLRPACQPAAVHQLSFVAAVAALAALRAILAPTGLNLPLQVKWPNDILVGGAKLVGILPESTIGADRSIVAVVGIGINVAHAPDSLGRATTSLATYEMHVTPQAMLDALSVGMRSALTIWNNGVGFEIIRGQWLQDAGPPGAAMTVHTGRDIVSGTFQGLDVDGALILRDHSGYDHRIRFGDVTLGNEHKTASRG